MASQEQKKTDSQTETTDFDDDNAPAPAAPQTTGSEATEGVDDLLDEIDGVLEVNAEEFVRGFVQKGGQ